MVQFQPDTKNEAKKYRRLLTMDISDVLTLARELNLTHIANGEVDLTNERVSNLDYLYTVLQEEVEIRHIERVKKLTKRSELVEEFYSDLYKWAKLNGETRTYEEYKTEIVTKIKNADEIKLIDPTLKDTENTNGGTEYFLNTRENR
jgi:hypothetical protein